ncbi:MAG: thioredoxin family protein [Bacteroidia bacterium]|nr:thioredoxin family protein [Bacteroidia bacterium]NNJ56571.1 thioredoxin fold domain-containing protein [Bacteroidia bacterium]
MRIFTVLLLSATWFLSSSFSSGNTGGISFQKDSYSEVKKLAKATNKIIFIDAYTVWCGPCKKMAANVFTDKEVGTFFNTNFYNVKMDMEKAEGMLFARRYNVNFYPTLLFVRPDGSVIKKEVGYKNKTQLLRIARAALN